MPAVHFPFEGSPEGEELQSVSNVNKRKKFKKNEVGRPSFGYVSSQESLKNVKKPKNDDLFGLDEMLGLNNNNKKVNSEAHVNVSLANGSDSLDLNRQPGLIEGGDNIELEDDSQSVTKVNDRVQAEEVLATIALDEKLGTDLTNCNALIQESINHEGLQRGKP
ncbi:hypothetical protein Hanom_Chr14g01298051 [Helianthus anomalus]